MTLIDQLEREGNWLFRWRSYLPVIFIPFIAIALVNQTRWPLGSEAMQSAWQVICLSVSVLGLAIRVIAVGHAPANTSGRNTESQLADQINTTGIYATVRHPLYLGNYLIALGVVMSPSVIWLPVVYSLSFWIYYERIMMAEEGFLRSKFGRQFTDWAEKTPPFIPRLSQWTKPAESFSLRSVLRREYTGLALMILMHCSVVEMQYVFAERRFLVAPFWTSLLAFGIISYLLLRQLKVHTKVLDVPGR